MFFSLGLKNAWRNRARTVLATVSIAVASVIFLSSSTLSRGYPAGAFLAMRQLMGGDILLIPEKSVLTREDLARGGYIWRFKKKSFDAPNLIMGLNPSAYSYGTIQGFPTSGNPGVTAERYAEVLASLTRHSAVKYAAIKQSLPFLVQLPSQVPTSTAPSYGYGFLDARDITQDRETWKIRPTSGEYLSKTDPLRTGVSCTGWSGLPILPGVPLNIAVPRYAGKTRPDGSPYLDYENPIRTLLRMKGRVSFTEGDDVTTLRTMSDPVVFVARDMLTALAQAAGYPPEATYRGISVTIKTMSELESVAALLRREFPDFTVLPASTLEGTVAEQAGMSAGVPMDMRRVSEVLAFITAALLSAVNLTVLMLSRRNEIGILRALGATRFNIACMVLTESVWIAFLGSLVGCIVTQPAILWQMSSNNAARTAIAREIGSGTGRTVAFSVATAVVFGFLPVARALRVTPAQVLRGE